MGADITRDQLIRETVVLKAKWIKNVFDLCLKKKGIVCPENLEDILNVLTVVICEAQQKENTLFCEKLSELNDRLEKGKARARKTKQI